ncbi:unnamed protein product [Owenia fusiformis]|uniref:Hexosyltransferase n=1 Tax=Owenia fusiformis TaxID=6347 RepID=A0A8J1Y5B7_OWEFU|nr:unnamed protein product [Owenia fusiformis]
MCQLFLGVFFALIAILMYYVILQYEDHKEVPHYHIIVGVMSARNHYKQRQAIRDTWLAHSQTQANISNKVVVKFVLGKKACHIPPEDRLDPYSCERWDVQVSDWENDITVAKVDNTSPSIKQVTAIEQLTFKVHHPIVITKIGLLAGDTMHLNYKVKLVDSLNGETIASAVFSDSQPGLPQEGFRYRAVENYLLPKHFEGTIIGEILDSEITNSTNTTTGFNIDNFNIKLYNGSGIISLYASDIFQTNQTSPVVSFMFKVYEPGALKLHIAGKKLRAFEWGESMELENIKVTEEFIEKNDMVLVNVIDTYRNLPLKLLKFYTWMTQRYMFNYTLKTDDDCYLNLENIVERSRLILDEGGSKQWWGQFRRNWYVERHGKWSERLYTSSSYPTFGCGAGNVLSSDLVYWLADNEENLQVYQGEDVSLGIWLAALGPQFIADAHWQCDNRTCEPDMYNMPELSPQQLTNMWQNKMKCGNPCGC